MAAARKMDELLVSWLGSDAVYESIVDLIEQYRKSQEETTTAEAEGGGNNLDAPAAAATDENNNPVIDDGGDKKMEAKKISPEEDQEEEGDDNNKKDDGTTNTADDYSYTDNDTNNTTSDSIVSGASSVSQQNSSSTTGSTGSPREVIIPPFYPPIFGGYKKKKYNGRDRDRDNSEDNNIEDNNIDNSSDDGPRRHRRRRTPPQPFESWYPMEQQILLPQQDTESASADDLSLVETGGGDTTTISAGGPGSIVVPPPPPSSSSDTGSNVNENNANNNNNNNNSNNNNPNNHMCVRDQVRMVFDELGQDPPLTSPSSDINDDDDGDPTSSTNRGFGTNDNDDNDLIEGARRNRSSIDDDGDDESSSRDDVLAEDRLNRNNKQKQKRQYLTVPHFQRITKDVFRFPSFLNVPLYQRILLLWNRKEQAKVNNTANKNTNNKDVIDRIEEEEEEGNDDNDDDNEQQRQHTIAPMDVVTYGMLEWFYQTELEPYDQSDRFFRLIKQPDVDYIVRDDFLPFLSALLQDHPGLEFLSSHAEFQEKYAATVLARIFYSVDTCHSGKITSRQLRRSDLLDAFFQVDEEEDINKVTRYLSYEHFYVLYCRFWELDHDRDLRITREDLLKYGDHSLSHMVVDRIFDAAPRPFEGENPNRDYLTYESFIYFMLSEEDKSNEVAVRYWFQCVDVDGDGKLNNMEMRSFYAVQLHRMQCMGQEIVPFEDMLCQMMDMIKPKNPDHFVVDDFLQPECCQVSGALFDALFNLNKYLLFEQRDPFVERQKREDEFECDWDRFACIDYNRLAMEEEAREEEAMEIDWVTVDEDEDAAANGGAGGGGGGGGATASTSNDGYSAAAAGAADPLGSVSEAPF